jgi:hypothetical protein
MMRNPRSGKGLVGGLLIIGIGIIFLLDQQHIVSAGQVFRIFWPAFFIVLGLEDLIGGYNVRKRTWGAILVAGGSLLLLNQLGYIHVQIGLLWPLILIVVGLWLLLQNFGFGGMGPYPPWSHRSHYSWHHGRGGPGGPGGPFDPQNPPQGPSSVPPAGAPSAGTPEAGTPSSGFQPPPPGSYGFQGGAAPQDPRDWLRWHKLEARRLRRAWRHGWTDPSQAQAQPGGQPGAFDSSEAQFRYSAICSHVERNITAKNFKSGSLSAIFGGFEIDLTRADIEGDEAVIYAEAFFGGGEIRIPETWHVVIEGNALFGAFMDETRQRPPEGTTPAKRLIIRGTAVFGGVSIEN